MACPGGAGGGGCGGGNDGNGGDGLARMAVMADASHPGQVHVPSSAQCRPAKRAAHCKACPFGSSRTRSQRSAGNSWTGRRIHHAAVMPAHGGGGRGGGEMGGEGPAGGEGGMSNLDNPTGCLTRTRIHGAAHLVGGWCLVAKSPCPRKSSAHAPSVMQGR